MALHFEKENVLILISENEQEMLIEINNILFQSDVNFVFGTFVISSEENVVVDMIFDKLVYFNSTKSASLLVIIEDGPGLDLINYAYEKELNTSERILSDITWLINKKLLDTNGYLFKNVQINYMK